MNTEATQPFPVCSLATTAAGFGVKKTIDGTAKKRGSTLVL
jgi:hypothetical protein